MTDSRRAHRDRDAADLDRAILARYPGLPEDAVDDPAGTAPDHEEVDYPTRMAAALRRLGLASPEEIDGATIGRAVPGADEIVDAMLAPLARTGARIAIAAARARQLAEDTQATARTAVMDAREQLRRAEAAERHAARRLADARSQERWTADYPARLADERTELIPHVVQAIAGTHPKWRLADAGIVSDAGRPLLPRSQRGHMRGYP